MTEPAESRAEQLIGIFNTLKAERANWEYHWQEVADRVLPNHSDFNVQRAPGEKRMARVFDSTAIHANNMLAAGLFSMLTSPSQKWFEMATGDKRIDEEPQIMIWLKDVTDIMFHEIRKSKAGFNTAMHEMYLEYCAFGTAGMFATEGKDNTLLFNALPLRELFVAESAEARVDTVYREYKRTVRQLRQKFGVKALSKDIQDKITAGKLEDKVDIIHIVMPREDAPKGSSLSKDKPIASIYIEVKGKNILREGGYDEMPAFVPRFYKGPTEKYGRGPGTDSLPWVKELQTVKKSTTKAIQKKADPPLMVPDDGFLNPTNTTPGGLNFYRAGGDPNDRIQAFGNEGDPAFALEYMRDTRESIKEMFFIDQLQLQQGPQKTATEVLQLVEQKLRLMGPIMGRIQTELLDLIIDRTFGILFRANKFPEPPEQLSGVELKVVYTSPIARAQEQLEANGLTRALDIVAPVVQMKPESVATFNSDAIIRGVFNMFSVTPEFLNEKEKVEENKAAGAEAAEMEQTAGVVQQMGQGIASVSGVQGQNKQ